MIIPESIPNNSTVVSIQFSTDFTMRGFTIDGLVTGNSITHFSDPVSHTAETNGVISGVFDPNRIVP